MIIPNHFVLKQRWSGIEYNDIELFILYNSCQFLKKLEPILQGIYSAVKIDGNIEITQRPGFAGGI